EKEDTQELDEEYYDQKSKVIKLKELQQGAKEEIENKTGVQSVSEFIDEEGNAIEARVKGKVTLKMLNIEQDIRQVKRFREDDSDVYGLQDSIRRYGLLEPVHAVPFGNYYILIQGYRRLQAHINLGIKHILAVIDSTIPLELVKYYQVEMNNVLDYRSEERRVGNRCIF